MSSTQELQVAIDATSSRAVERLLDDWSCGEGDARDRLFGVVLQELKRIAASLLRRERRPNHTLQTTALVHEAYLRMARQHTVRFESEGDFYRAAGRVMRLALVDHARRKGAVKRGGGASHRSLEDGAHAGAVGRAARVEPEALHRLASREMSEALDRLAEIDRDAAAVVDLHIFAGLSLKETWLHLGLARATALRRWRFARVWLARALSEGRSG